MRSVQHLHRPGGPAGAPRLPQRPRGAQVQGQPRPTEQPGPAPPPQRRHQADAETGIVHESLRTETGPGRERRVRTRQIQHGGHVRGVPGRAGARQHQSSRSRSHLQPSVRGRHRNLLERQRTLEALHGGHARVPGSFRGRWRQVLRRPLRRPPRPVRVGGCSGIHALPAAQRNGQVRFRDDLDTNVGRSDGDLRVRVQIPGERVEQSRGRCEHRPADHQPVRGEVPKDGPASGKCRKRQKEEESISQTSFAAQNC